MKRILVAMMAAGLLAGCGGPPRPVPGTGWSRAPDLSVFSAMTLFATVARTESSLCRGVSPASIEAGWEADFGAREAAVTSALVARHGADAVETAQAAAAPTRRVPCPNLLTDRWQYRYEQLLHLLELRLGLA